MKIRPCNTVSERQLILLLNAKGYKVSFSDLSAWRGDGLLPPLASRGRHCAGRTYYWDDPSVIDQAIVAAKELNRHGRADLAIITLWLRGYTVPLSRLKRAWLHNDRIATPPRIQVHPIQDQSPADDLSAALNRASATIGAAMHFRDSSPIALELLETAAERLGLAGGLASHLRTSWQLIQLTLMAVSSSNLIEQASASVMERARHILQIAIDFIYESSASDSRAAVADAIGKPLFLYILTLLCSGQQQVIDCVLSKINPLSRCSSSNTPRSVPKDSSRNENGPATGAGPSPLRFHV